jgi:hypothetical protein
MLSFAITAVLAVSAAATDVPGLVFDRVPIGHNSTYEAASILDVNNDGFKDIFSGAYWYEGPDFAKAHKVCDLMYVDTYYDDFSNYPMDVNGDGYLDIVAGGYFGCILQWRENPKGGPGEWATHDVAKTGNIERNVFYDMDGDGVDEVMPVTKPVYIFKLKRDANGKGTGEFEQFTVETDGGGGHGFGAGDLNGDGYPDMIFTGGWLEAPENTWDMKAWKWHPEFNIGSASVPVLVFDVNGDGKNDMIVGEAHNYGLFWMEQGVDAQGGRTWAKHEIETDRSQFHDLQLHDIDNDGEVELVTGKRFWAHNGHDPGDRDPLGVYYYEINKGAFTRTTIDFGPAATNSGLGIYFWVDDINADGWKDILAPGKQGLYLFLNRGKSVKVYN